MADDGDDEQQQPRLPLEFSSRLLMRDDAALSHGSERVLHKPLFSAGGALSVRNIAAGGVAEGAGARAAGGEAAEADGSAAESAGGEAAEVDDGSVPADVRLSASLPARMAPSSRLLYSNPDGARVISDARAGGSGRNVAAGAVSQTTPRVLPARRDSASDVRKVNPLERGPLTALPMSAVPATPRLVQARSSSFTRGMQPAAPEAAASFWRAAPRAADAAPPGIFAHANPLSKPARAGAAAATRPAAAGAAPSLVSALTKSGHAPGAAPASPTRRWARPGKLALAVIAALAFAAAFVAVLIVLLTRAAAAAPAAAVAAVPPTPSANASASAPPGAPYVALLSANYSLQGVSGDEISSNANGVATDLRASLASMLRGASGTGSGSPTSRDVQYIATSTDGGPWVAVAASAAANSDRATDDDAIFRARRLASSPSTVTVVSFAIKCYDTTNTCGAQILSAMSDCCLRPDVCSFGVAAANAIAGLGSSAPSTTNGCSGAPSVVSAQRARSPSNTALRTASPTPPPPPTPGGSPSSNSTASATVSPSPTKTSTVSGSANATANATGSGTGSRSATGTRSSTSSNAPTPSQTPSNSSTATASLTNGVSASVTATGTQTPSGTASPSGTPTVTSSQTSSATNTETGTLSQAATPSSTAYVTRTLTRGVSASGTANITATVTATPSNTQTGSGTQTPTQTPSNTSTQTPSATQTISGTSSLTATTSANVTATPSNTQTETRTQTPSQTSTTTPTVRHRLRACRLRARISGGK